ncbi:MAG: DUF481 domain-containing protein [Acidimicrobiia bacterium]|nr:DUF481 domain-containing protein [Acidimicrobiia bacterium]
MSTAIWLGQQEVTPSSFFHKIRDTSVTFGEKLQHRLTPTATLTQSFTGLWKTKDFEDSLYTIGAGIAVTVSTRTQLKFEVLDVYKNNPPLPTLKKNDLATLLAVVYKI